MDLAIDIVARLIGAFYAFGGWLALRYLLTDDLLDKMIAALKVAQPEPKDVVRRRVLAGVGLLTCLSGVALLLLSRWAPVLFLAGLAAQGALLVWAGRTFPPKDAADRKGRRGTINAAVVYSAVTAVVLWLQADGRLSSWSDPVGPTALVLVGGVLGVWMWGHLRWRAGEVDDEEVWPEFEPDLHPPTRVRLAPMIGDWTLWDADDGRGLDPFTYLPEALAQRIEQWEAVRERALDPEDVFGPPRFETPVAAREYAEETVAIVAALEAVFGAGNVEVAADEAS